MYCILGLETGRARIQSKCVNVQLGNMEYMEYMEVMAYMEYMDLVEPGECGGVVKLWIWVMDGLVEWVKQIQKTFVS